MLANVIFGVNRKTGSPKSPKTPPSFKDEGFSEGPLVVSYNAFGSLFEDNPHPMWIYDAKKLRFLAVNNAAIQNYMYAREEFSAMTIDQIHPPEEVESLKKHLEAPQQSGPRRVWRHRRKDGTILYADLTARPMMFHGHKAQLVVASDVTAVSYTHLSRGLFKEKHFNQSAASRGQLRHGFSKPLFSFSFGDYCKRFRGHFNAGEFQYLGVHAHEAARHSFTMKTFVGGNR